MVNDKLPDYPIVSREQVPMTLQRRAQIVDLVHKNGSVRVAELAARFQVSEVTVRNDLAELEQEGKLIRDRGGAITGSTSRQITSLLAVEQRAHLQIAAKQRIARAAASMVQPGDTIILDAGTTVVGMAAYLKEVRSLTVVTNALNVAMEISVATDAEIILLGGKYDRTSSGTLGTMVEKTLAELTVAKLFLGAQAFDFEHGITDTSLDIAHLKRAMIGAAREVILLSDSTKWASTGFIRVTPLSTVRTIITDDQLLPAAQRAIREERIDLLLV